MQRNKVINGHRMVVRIEFVDEHLRITGDTMNNRDLKVIVIPKGDDLFMLEHDCKGRAEKIMEKLQYDQLNDLLYFVSSIEEETNPEEITQPKTKRLDPIKANKPLEKSTLNQSSNQRIT